MRLFRPFRCLDFVESVTDYLENVLPARARARFERHLARCPHCQSYLSQMRDTLRLLAAIGAE